MSSISEVVADFVTEGEDLDGRLSKLEPNHWALETPAPGWSVAHQVAHLSSVFRMAAMSASAPEAFTAMSNRLGGDFDANIN